MSDLNLSQPTLRIFLFLRQKHKKQGWGLRETQRALRFKSPSSVTWHLNKLIDLGLVVKLSSKKYLLSQTGKDYTDVTIPYQKRLNFISGIFIPDNARIVSFNILSLITVALLFLFEVNINAVIYFSVAIIIINVILNIKVLIESKQGVSLFINQFEDSD